MPYIPPQVVQEVKRIDLLTYLKNYEPYELVHFSGNTYTTRTHDSLKISNGKWMWWSRGIGGRSALDYLIKVKDYSFLEAVELLAGQANIQPPLSVSEQLPVEKHLLLPKENRYHTNVFSYLTGRGIDNDIVRFCIETGRIYESAYHHNAVFVGMDQQGKPSYHSMVKADVDEAIRKARTEKQFFFYLREKGYSFKFGKDITIRPEGRERGLKLKRNFGENYSLEAIRVRILEENELLAEKKLPILGHYRIRISGNSYQPRKIGGLRGLYLHYCYLLGILPKIHPSISSKQVHVLFREDLLKLNTISKEAKLLCHYHIDTVEKLFLLKERLQKKMEQCVEERKHLRYKIRADRPEEEIQDLKEQIKGLTEEIGTLRKEVVLCDGIAARSKVIEEKFKMVREEKEKKEEQSHEHIRRSR